MVTLVVWRVRSRADAGRVVRWRSDTLTTRPEASNREADPLLDGFTRWRFRDVTVFGVHGDATPIGLMTVFREFLSDPTPLVLWDMRECSLKLLTVDELHWLVCRLTRADHRERPSGKSAFVCSGEDRNVVRLLVAFAEANDYGIDLAVFTHLDAAQRWLFNDPSGNRGQ